MFASLWIKTSRTEWALRSGRKSVRRRVAHWTLREHDFPASSTIEIEHREDSDGDDRYALVIKDSSERRVLDRFDDYRPQELRRRTERRRWPLMKKPNTTLRPIKPVTAAIAHALRVTHG